MSHFHSNPLLGASGSQGYEIRRSLRFNDDDSAYLNFTPGSAGNQKTWTWSAWIKRSENLGSNQHIFNPVNGGDGFNEAAMRFDANDRFQVYDSGTLRGNLITNKIFRDVSAWYHIVVALDTTQGTAADRLKVYVNGEEQTDLQTASYPSQDTTWGWNGTQRHDLGRYAYGSSLYFDGYIAEVNFVDGTQLAVSNFGETDSDSGAWIPKQYSGSHGSQGWYLDFSDNSGATATTLGKDSSGNSNNWTPNNFSVTAGTGNDSLEDTPTNNWCTLNPLNRGVDNPTVSNGNLYLSSPSTDHAVVATFGIPSSGKWYWEYSKTADANLMSGIIHSPEDGVLSTYVGGNSNGYSVYASNGNKYNNASASTYMATPATSTTITIAFDADNNKLYFGADGNWADGSGNTDQTFANAVAAFTVATGYTYFPAISFNGGNAFANFGQRPFDHTPPTGYKALNAANLPVSTIKDGTEYFNTVLWTGNSSTQAIPGVGFQPDFVWGKARSVGYAHKLFDVVRGTTKALVSSSTAAETTVSGVTSFDSDGFTLGSNLDLNLTTHTYVAWNWKAGGAATTPTQGTISSTASVNTEAGFSIVEYTGNSTAGATVGHGLGVAPKVIITKTSSTNLGNWGVYHYGVDPTSPEDYMLNLNLGNGRTNSALWWNDTAPTSTVFTVGTSNDVNGSSDYIAYCFAEIEGYSKFGSYEGNGSTNGTYIYTGFSPAFFLLKDVDRSNTRWIIIDSVRDPHNYAYHVLSPSGAQAEDTSESYWLLDFVSNGVKLRYGADSEFNKSGDTYIYMAFAENPFKYANAR